MGKPNDFLRTAREKQGWTQAEVAGKIGTTSVNVSRWENSATFPSPYYRQKLCELYSTSARELGLTHESEEEEVPGVAHPFFYLMSRCRNQENCTGGSENGKRCFPEPRARHQPLLSVRAELAKPGSCTISNW